MASRKAPRPAAAAAAAAYEDQYYEDYEHSVAPARGSRAGGKGVSFGPPKTKLVPSRYDEAPFEAELPRPGSTARAKPARAALSPQSRKQQQQEEEDDSYLYNEYGEYIGDDEGYGDDGFNGDWDGAGADVAPSRGAGKTSVRTALVWWGGWWVAHCLPWQSWETVGVPGRRPRVRGVGVLAVYATRIRSLARCEGCWGVGAVWTGLCD
jgi:hypothetical protein